MLVLLDLMQYVDDYLSAAAIEPWMFVGPPVLTVIVIIFLYIVCYRLIDDDSWSTRTRFPVPSNSTVLSFKQETPTSSLVLSKDQFIKHHNWRFVSSFSTEEFPIESMLK